MRLALKIFASFNLLISTISFAEETETIRDRVIAPLADIFRGPTEGTLNQSSTLPFETSGPDVAVISQIAVFTLELSPENVNSDFNAKNVRDQLHALHDDSRATDYDKKLIKDLLERVNAIEADSAKAKSAATSSR